MFGLREKYPAFLLVPQTKTGWVKRPERGLNNGGGVFAGEQPECPARKLALQALAEVMKDYSVDAERVYVSGQSTDGQIKDSLVSQVPASWIDRAKILSPGAAAESTAPTSVEHCIQINEVTPKGSLILI